MDFGWLVVVEVDCEGMVCGICGGIITSLLFVVWEMNRVEDEGGKGWGNRNRGELLLRVMMMWEFGKDENFSLKNQPTHRNPAQPTRPFKPLGHNPSIHYRPTSYKKPHTIHQNHHPITISILSNLTVLITLPSRRMTVVQS